MGENHGHEHPTGWAIIITPGEPGEVRSYHPGLSQQDALDMLTELVRHYRRDLGIEKPLVVE